MPVPKSDLYKPAEPGKRKRQIESVDNYAATLPGVQFDLWHTLRIYTGHCLTWVNVVYTFWFVSLPMCACHVKSETVGYWMACTPPDLSRSDVGKHVRHM